MTGSTCKCTMATAAHRTASTRISGYNWCVIHSRLRADLTGGVYATARRTSFEGTRARDIGQPVLVGLIWSIKLQLTDQGHAVPDRVDRRPSHPQLVGQYTRPSCRQPIGRRRQVGELAWKYSAFFSQPTRSLVLHPKILWSRDCAGKNTLSGPPLQRALDQCVSAHPACAGSIGRPNMCEAPRAMRLFAAFGFHACTTARMFFHVYETASKHAAVS